MILWLCQHRSTQSPGSLNPRKQFLKEEKLGDKRSLYQKSKRTPSILVAPRMRIQVQTTNWVKVSTTGLEITLALAREFKFNGLLLQLTSKKKTSMLGKVVPSSMRGWTIHATKCRLWIWMIWMKLLNPWKETSSLHNIKTSLRY